MPLMPPYSVADLSGPQHEVLDALRREAPVVWVPALDGWVVATRELASAVMRDATTFTVDDPRFSTAQVIGPSMLSLDGSEHARHRDPFAAAYRPAEVVSRYGAAITEAAEGLVDRLVASTAQRSTTTRTGDLRGQLAGPLAVAVVGMSLGLDDLQPAQLLDWYGVIVAAVEAVSAGQAVDPAAIEAFRSLGRALDTAVRREGSVLESAAAELDRDEMIANAAVFLFGGIETSEGMTASLLAHVLGAPEQLEMVRADRRLVDAAVEESLRLEPAAARVDRYATRDVVLGGAEIAAGDLVVVSLAAANRDPAVYVDPHRFDVRRKNARTHVAFAHGPHACIGAQLARMEARAALVAVLDALPDARLVEPVATIGLVFRKPQAVRITW